MSFISTLREAQKKNNSLVCVGLDPELLKFPAHLKSSPDGLFEFHKAIIDTTADLVCCYKPQIAHFAALSAEASLQRTIAYVHTNYPGIPVILDAKRGDIGSTAERYAIEAFDRYQADAVTLNPYLGRDSIQPFLDHKDKGVILLCRTSNKGANDFQDLISNGKPLYQHVARTVTEQWNENGNCMLVVGATWPEQLAQVRSIVGDMPFLVPGVGAQGGDVEAMVKSGKTANGDGLVISSSRAILYASSGEDFADAARKATITLRNDINRYR
jgi:orotidine-5'-phosphate decarboxylase